jgi:hypothetical protein
MKQQLNDHQSQGRASTISILIIIMFYCVLNFNWLGFVLNLIWFIVIGCAFGKMKNKKNISVGNLLKIHLIALMGAVCLLYVSLI